MSTEGNVSAGQGGDRVPVYDSYARLSRVPETGELEKIETQHEDNLRVIERLGGTLGERLQDGLSAWKRGVRRKDWERLLERLESGQSDGVVVWHTDRLFRQPRDLEKLIELGESGYLVASAHGARNLADPDDRYFLRIEVAHAARSSDDTQRRTKRRFAAKREQGIPHYGARPFGFAGPDRLADKDPKTGKRPDVSAALVERERAAIRDGVRLLLGGMSQDKVAQKWNDAGLRTARGYTFTGLAVRDVMLRPRNAGYIEHDGEIVGRIRDHDPILTESEFARLQALFAGRRRGRRRGVCQAIST
ncbi:recombinase family protein [Kibdelosporangium philippinense]|uniref:recombinase family protein n=1 Tax=Kibdelosporangium philippinense TaxID=211113 RepID=UPI00362041D0